MQRLAAFISIPYCNMSLINNQTDLHFGAWLSRVYHLAWILWFFIFSEVVWKAFDFVNWHHALCFTKKKKNCRGNRLWTMF